MTSLWTLCHWAPERASSVTSLCFVKLCHWAPERASRVTSLCGDATPDGPVVTSRAPSPDLCLEPVLAAAASMCTPCPRCRWVAGPHGAGTCDGGGAPGPGCAAFQSPAPWSPLFFLSLASETLCSTLVVFPFHLRHFCTTRVGLKAGGGEQEGLAPAPRPPLFGPTPGNRQP